MPEKLKVGYQDFLVKIRGGGNSYRELSIEEGSTVFY